MVVDIEFKGKRLITVSDVEDELQRLDKALFKAEAACAEMREVLIETKKEIQYQHNLQTLDHLPYLNRLDAAIKSCGQPLLARLAAADKLLEATKSVYGVDYDTDENLDKAIAAYEALKVAK